MSDRPADPDVASTDDAAAAAIEVAHARASGHAHFRVDRIELDAFKCVEAATVELGPGLNVLFGPNDLGKSSIGEALRAVLLLPPTSIDRKEFEMWGRDQPPTVQLRFRHGGAMFRVRKTWGEGARGTAMLERSEDGHVWSKVDTGRAVDGELRKMLGWGVKEPGGRGAPKGLPKSFITTALLAASSRIEELFADDLGQDTDPAGRERLSEALQSLAEDPMFKRMLTEAQQQVERAKDSRGNFRRAKDSPLGRIGERIRVLAEELDQHERLAQQSDSVNEVLREARARKEELRDRLGEAQLDRTRRRAAYEAGSAWRAARAELAVAEEALAAFDRDAARRARLAEELAAVRESVANAVDTQQRAAAATTAAEQKLRTATDELAALERSDATVRAREELGARELELRRRHQQHTVVRAQITEAVALDRAAVTASTAAAQATSALQAAERALASKRAEVARHETEHRRSLWLGAALRWRDASTRLAAIERMRADSQAAAARARLLRQDVAGRRTALERQRPPDPATLAALGELDARRRRAEDQAAVGFAVTVVEGASAPQIVVDGTAGACEPGATIAARRDMKIVIPGWGTLVVAAGSDALRDELAAATARWQEDGQPILAVHGASTFDALVAAATAWNERAAQCDRDDQTAAGLEREAAAGGVDEAALTTTRSEVTRAAAAVLEHADAGVGEDERAVIDRAVAEVGTRDAATHEQEHAALTAALATARAARSELELQLAGATSTASERRRAADEAIAKADAARKGLSPAHAADPVTAAAELDDEIAAIERGLATITREIASLQETGARETAAVRQRVAAATAEVERARVVQREADVAIAGLREKAAAAAARLDEAVAAAPGGARETAAALVDKRQRELAAIGEPTSAEDESTLAAADLEVDRLTAQLHEVDAEIQKAEGSLEQIGGQTARARAEDTRAQLAASKQAEADVQREIEGWQLLRDTLRAVETEQGRHVGDALAGAVETRLRALTGDRYGRLDLDRDLKAQGLRVAGSARAITSLSAGLKEQLATLVRLAVAEHLDATLVLDDHLAQTDPARVDFFRELLRDVASRVQVVVLTCRPLDYLEPGELPSATAVRDSGTHVRAIDLERVIRRLPVSSD